MKNYDEGTWLAAEMKEQVLNIVPSISSLSLLSEPSVVHSVLPPF
jgi:precorrin-6B methylase 1